MSIFINFLKGIAIGAGAIIPGVSSGVICVIFGIYEKLLESVLNFFKDFKSNINFLLPVALGSILGIILFGKIINYLLAVCPNQISYIFIGLIIGSIPALIKSIEKKEKFKHIYMLYLLFSLLIGFSMVMLEKNITNVMINEEYSIGYLFFAGICMSVGVVVPGVSSTVILMLLGVYSSYINAIATINLPTLIPIVIGLIIGALICMKIIKYLFENFYAKTFYTIIGFTMGSIFVLYPGFTFDINGIISILCLIMGIYISKIFK